jgi:small conductance mechanosensitive channel
MVVLPGPLPGAADEGWLYDVLTRAGVSPGVAHDVVTFVVRPLAIVLVVVVAYLVARIGARAIRRGMTRASRRAVERSESARAGARAATMAALAANVWRFVIGVVAFAIVLGMLGINLAPLLASATVIGAIVAFGAQSLVRDYLSGFLLTVEDQFGIGDEISVNGTDGVVEDLSLRVTRVRAADGTLWYVPNGDIRRLANESRGWAKAVVDVPIAIHPGIDLQRAQAAIVEAAEEVARRPQFSPTCTEPPEVLGIVAAEGGACTARVTLRTTPADRASLTRVLREKVTERLVADGLWPSTAEEPPAAEDDGAA